MGRKRQGIQLNLKTVEAVSRALQVLKHLQVAAGGATSTELAAETGLNRTTVMRILVTLEEQRYVTWNPHQGTYSLGSGALELSAAYLSTNDLPSVSLSELKRLRDETGESASLYVRDGIHRTCIQRVESLQGLRRSIQLGQRLPIHLGASGKVLLSVLPEAIRESIYRQCPATPEELGRLREEVDRSKKQGWAMSIEEREQGVAAVAVPIVPRFDTESVALSISGPANRMTPDTFPELVRLLKESALRITNQLFV